MEKEEIKIGKAIGKYLWPDEDVQAHINKKGSLLIWFTNDYPMQHGDGEQLRLPIHEARKLYKLISPPSLGLKEVISKYTVEISNCGNDYEKLRVAFKNHLDELSKLSLSVGVEVSDEEIEEESKELYEYDKKYGEAHSFTFKRGARWMRDKLSEAGKKDVEDFTHKERLLDFLHFVLPCSQMADDKKEHYVNWYLQVLRETKVTTITPKELLLLKEPQSEGKELKRIQPEHPFDHAYEEVSKELSERKCVTCGRLTYPNCAYCDECLLK